MTGAELPAVDRDRLLPRLPAEESDIARWYSDGRDFVDMNGEMYLIGALVVEWAELREDLEDVVPMTAPCSVAPKAA